MGKQITNFFTFRETVFKFKAIFHFHGIIIHNLYSRLKLDTYFNIANTNISPKRMKF